MPIITVLLMSSLFLTSCGVMNLFKGNEAVSPTRSLSSISTEELILEENETFTHEIEEKLYALHSYQVIAQWNLIEFEKALETRSLFDVYETTSYLNLLATRIQLEEIEENIEDLWSKLRHQKDSQKKEHLLKETLNNFANKSRISATSVSRILSLETDIDLTVDEVKSEYSKLEVTKEFQIYEKNIEHLSHLLSSRAKEQAKSFYPSSTKNGNVTGHEFPSKVWALTFNDGPNNQVSSAILKNLIDRELKATFFQLSQTVLKNPKVYKSIINAGMEIASHSSTHRLLTLAGAATLEEEITQATHDMERILDTQIKFFRLPYAAGVNVPNIRQKITENKLIHVSYSIDSLDWIVQSPDRIIRRTKKLMKKSVKDSGIIIFHDTHESSISSSVAIMEELKLNGRRACTVGEIVDQMNADKETICQK